jgi:predicted ATP-dependent endonuclease of OLD family
VAQRLFTNDELRDQGILSRVLVAMPESLKSTRFLSEDEEALRERQIAKEVMGMFGERIVALLEKRPAVSKDYPQELTPRTLQLEAAARMRLVDFYNLGETQQLEGCLYANISGFAGKAAEQVARIAGNIALFEDPEAQLISLEQLAIGITLMEFYLAEAVRIFDTGHVSQNLLDAEDLRKWLCDRYADDFVDVSEISKRGPRRLRSSEKIKVLMRILEEYGHLKQSGGVVVSINGRNSRKAYRIIRS